MNKTIITKSRKEKLDLLIKLDKCETECLWDYEIACEYRNMKAAKNCVKIQKIIEKKTKQIWDQLVKSFKVEHERNLPIEIINYYNDGTRKNRYDRFNDYESDLIRLGIIKRK